MTTRHLVIVHTYCPMPFALHLPYVYCFRAGNLLADYTALQADIEAGKVMARRPNSKLPDDWDGSPVLALSPDGMTLKSFQLEDIVDNGPPPDPGSPPYAPRRRMTSMDIWTQKY